MGLPMMDISVDALRTCTCCGAKKPTSGFYKTTLKATGRTQFHSACKPCFKQRMEKYEKTAKERNNGMSRSVLARSKNINSYAAHIINLARKRSAKKNVEFSIDVDWFTSTLKSQNWKCAISGIEMVAAAGTGERLFNGISIDRIDNSKGYTPANCWLVCYSVNALKSNHDLRVVLDVCRAIVTRWDC
jgi:hypothetical protein